MELGSVRVRVRGRGRIRGRVRVRKSFICESVMRSSGLSYRTAFVKFSDLIGVEFRVRVEVRKIQLDPDEATKSGKSKAEW